MSRPHQPPFPTSSFGLLLVEGGDERGVCEAVAGPTAWAGLVCWSGRGRTDLPRLAGTAANDPSIRFARSVGVVLDAEDDLAEAQAIAARALAVFRAAGSPLRLGAFIAPDGANPGSIETLCRKAVRNSQLAGCVNALLACAGSPHSLQARTDKGWIRAYLGMLPEPSLHMHQAFDPKVVGGIDPAHAAFDPLRAFLGAL